MAGKKTGVTQGREYADEIIDKIALKGAIPTLIFSSIKDLDADAEFLQGYMTRIASMAATTRLRPFVTAGECVYPAWIMEN